MYVQISQSHTWTMLETVPASRFSGWYMGGGDGTSCIKHINCLHPGKTNIAGWKMDPFKMHFLLKIGDVPIAMLVSGRVHP